MSKCARPTCDLQCNVWGIYCMKHAKQYRKKTGRYYVDATPSRERIEELRKSGLGWHRISELSGLSARGLRQIVQGQKYVLACNEKKILSVPASAADGARIPLIGTQRRLQALVAIGYTNEELAAAINYSRTQFGYILYQDHPYVFGSTARRVAEVFERLHMTPAPDTTAARRARNRAAKRGWHPPLAWEDIDNPEAKPFVGEANRGDWLLHVMEAREFGRDDKTIAGDLGITVENLKKRLERWAA